MDHSTPTTSRDLPMLDPIGKAQLDQMTQNCKDFGIRLYDLTDLPNDFYMVRQYHSLLIARGMYYQHLTSVPECSLTENKGIIGRATEGVQKGIGAVGKGLKSLFGR